MEGGVAELVGSHSRNCAGGKPRIGQIRSFYETRQSQ
jgi:hypothetical protein